MARKRRGEGQTALVTGASSGIGAALAEQFAKDGYTLVLVARSAEGLAKVADALAEKHHVQATVVPCDLGVPGGGAALVDELKRLGIAVDVLVNNAGFGDIGPFADSDLSKQLGMVDLNVRAVVELTRMLLPAMVAAKRGGVLNTASTAAYQPGPFMAVYYASKAFVLSFTEALNDELKGTGVTATALCPGPVVTGFQHRAEMHQAKLLTYVPLTSARHVARKGYLAFRRGRRSVIPGLFNWLLATSVPFTPRSLVLRIARFLQG